jgi:peptidyl-prolyl cis-trans isomerase A (cyclophilin A)
MKSLFTIAAVSVCSVLFCHSEEKAPAAKNAAPKVEMKTSQGRIVVELNPSKAPISVKNFLSYVEKKHYDGTVFHRVIPGFMIQGGGFAVEEGRLIERETGKGIKNEAQNGLRNEKGTIAMARRGDPNSATSQFFLNATDNTRLDFPNPDGHGYAVFGKVIEGMDVLEKIEQAATTQRPLVMLHPETGQRISNMSPDVPSENIVVESIRLLQP